MGLIKCPGHLNNDAESDCFREAALPLHHFESGGTVDEFDGHIVIAALFSRGIDLDNVLMVESRGRTGFPMESVDEFLIRRQPRGQNLERNIPTQTLLCRPVNNSHSAFAEFAGDLKITQGAYRCFSGFISSGGRLGDSSSWWRRRGDRRIGWLAEDIIHLFEGEVAFLDEYLVQILVLPKHLRLGRGIKAFPRLLVVAEVLADRCLCKKKIVFRGHLLPRKRNY